MTVPKEIIIKSDGNILTLKDTVKTKDGLKYLYEYTVSKTKLGDTLELDEVQLQKIINLNK